jgi:cell division protein FtsL
MQEDEFYEEIETRESFTERYLGLSLMKFILALIFVLALGVYIGILLFGENSLEVLIEIQEYQEYLENQVGELKESNSKLQKEYFELKELERDSK